MLAMFMGSGARYLDLRRGVALHARAACPRAATNQLGSDFQRDRRGIMTGAGWLDGTRFGRIAAVHLLPDRFRGPLHAVAAPRRP